MRSKPCTHRLESHAPYILQQRRTQAGPTDNGACPATQPQNAPQTLRARHTYLTVATRFSEPVSPAAIVASVSVVAPTVSVSVIPSVTPAVVTATVSVVTTPISIVVSAAATSVVSVSAPVPTVPVSVPIGPVVATLSVPVVVSVARTATVTITPMFKAQHTHTHMRTLLPIPSTHTCLELGMPEHVCLYRQAVDARLPLSLAGTSLASTMQPVLHQSGQKHVLPCGLHSSLTFLCPYLCPYPDPRPSHAIQRAAGAALPAGRLGLAAAQPRTSL